MRTGNRKPAWGLPAPATLLYCCNSEAGKTATLKLVPEQLFLPSQPIFKETGASQSVRVPREAASAATLYMVNWQFLTPFILMCATVLSRVVHDSRGIPVCSGCAQFDCWRGSNLALLPKKSRKNTYSVGEYVHHQSSRSIWLWMQAAAVLIGGGVIS